MTISKFTGQYEAFSNFYHIDIPCINPKNSIITMFPSVEHAFHSGKNSDTVYWQALAETRSPHQAKRLGRLCKLRHDWEEVKIDFMGNLLLYKFSQPGLKNLLLSTKGVNIVEGNYWHDNFWGDCGCNKCINKEGLNHLGKLLMKVRTKLQ